jgi:hypothetical protein
VCEVVPFSVVHVNFRISFCRVSHPFTHNNTNNKIMTKKHSLPFSVVNVNFRIFFVAVSVSRAPSDDTILF